MAEHLKENTATPTQPLDEQERLATLGSLASTISHDFNNLISSIQGSAQMALRELENHKRVEKGLESILLAARHSRDLVEQITAFNREQTPELKPIDFEKIIQESVQLLELRAHNHTRIVVETNEVEDCFILGSSSKLNQVIMNLGINALQAMREKGGLLRLALTTETSIQGAPIACLAVIDEGSGISAEAAAQIFDPYFTTKSFGVGTGLGLAVVKQVVDLLEGNIRLESEPGKGSTFKVSFKMTEERPPPLTELEKAATALPASHKKKAILLVDDEPFMRGLGMDMLHSLGFRVTVAGNGKEALDLIDKRPDYFDIVLSDSKMPEMTGPELAEELKEINPQLPFVLVSAFTDEETELRLKNAGVNEIVKKPFLIQNLEKALSTALEN